MYPPQKISSQGVVRITVEYGLEQRLGFRLPAQAKVSLGLKKQGGRLLPELKVVIEQEHGGERGREVINFRGLSLELAGIHKHAAEELLRLCVLAEFFAR